jgi:hypothetical protein
MLLVAERYSKSRSLLGRPRMGLALEGKFSQVAVVLGHLRRVPANAVTPTHRSVLYMLVPGMVAAVGITPTAVFRASLPAFIARSFRL